MVCEDSIVSTVKSSDTQHVAGPRLSVGHCYCNLDRQDSRPSGLRAAYAVLGTEYPLKSQLERASQPILQSNPVHLYSGWRDPGLEREIGCPPSQAVWEIGLTTWGLAPLAAHRGLRGLLSPTLRAFILPHPPPERPSQTTSDNPSRS